MISFLEILYSIFYRLYMEYSRVRNTVAFLHPFCDMGGGGERVLWCIISSLLRSSDYDIVIYTHTKKSVVELVNDVHKRFGISIPNHFTERIRLQNVIGIQLILPESFPFATLIFQAIGSMIFALINMILFCPQRLVDTAGYPFTYPIFKYLGGVQVSAYTHYPIISKDMIDIVDSQEETFNNKQVSPAKSFIKGIYYRCFAFLYKFTGKCLTFSMTNSTWSQNHLCHMWGYTPTIIYPPANLNDLTALATANPKRQPLIVSLSQFRPEKNHSAQITSFALAIKNKQLPKDVKLIVCGATRNFNDEKIVEDLKKLAEDQLGHDWHSRIEFRTNSSWPEILKLLTNATAAIHTMKREHFGISLVEFLAAGLVVIAHNSGGPKLDILKPLHDSGKDIDKIGFLCESDEEFATALEKVFNDENVIKTCRKNALKSLVRFEDDIHFGESVCKVLLNGEIKKYT